MKAIAFPLVLTIVAFALLAFTSMGCSDAAKGASDELPPAPIIASESPSQTATFPSADGRMLPFDVYAPKGDVNLHRAVILIHGGGWVGGGRSEMGDIGRYLSGQGFTGVSIDYTLAHTKLWPAQLEDVQAAVRYVRAKAKEMDVDPSEIAAAGISAGGHLSMFLGCVDDPKDGVSSKVQAVCSISGIHDLNASLTEGGNRYRIIEQLLGEADTPNREARRKASPIEAVTKDSAPTLFIQGKVDPLVPQAQSDTAAARLQRAGVEAKVVLVEGMGHGLRTTAAPEQKALEDAATWLKFKLKAK